MNLKIEKLQPRARVWEIMAQFGQPIDQATLAYLKEDGLGDGETRAVGCMGWIYSQWLMAGPATEIHKRVEEFVERGMEMQSLSPKFYKRPVHDLYLLHCAIFGSSDEQLKTLAKRVVDASGYKKYTPRNDGELYTSAYCGMLKYWILGDWEKAIQQSEIIWGAHHYIAYRAASKPLITPWLKRDWKAFPKFQRKDFERLWARARKYKKVISENDLEVVVDLDVVNPLPQLWCWAHCGMALLAHRQGIEVATDPFWFPPHALKCLNPTA